jgi:SPP1 family predicted phage head-tail adaptor
MKAGLLRQRITFQRRTSALNEYREAKDSWRTLVSVWASVEPISGREFFTAMQVQSDITTRIKCRYSSVVAGIKTQDRILHGKTVYDIRHPPIDVDMRHREMQFMCTQHVGE